MIQSLLQKLDQSHDLSRAVTRPVFDDELTSRFSTPWDVRTFAFLGDARSPVSWGLVHLIAGRPRVRGLFERGGSADDVFLIAAFLVEGRFEPHVRVLPRSALSVDGDAVQLVSKGVTLKISGQWPGYRLSYQSSASVRFEAEWKGVSPLHHWAKVRGVYSHYSAFGSARGSLDRDGKSAAFSGVVSAEHGQGAQVGVGRFSLMVPLGDYHYEVVALDNGDQLAFARAGMMGNITAISRGVFREAASGRCRAFGPIEVEVLDQARVRSRNPGVKPRLVPTRWRVRAPFKLNPAQCLSYEGEGLAPGFSQMGELSVTPARILDFRTGDALDEHGRQGMGYFEWI